MTANHEDIRDYLLGKLDSAESEVVDLRIIEDEEFGIDALAAEDTLIESYIDGELSDADAESFRANYLTTEARASRVKQFAALRAAVSIGDQQGADAPEAVLEESVGWFSRFRLVPAFAGLLVLLVLGYGAWFYLYDGQTELEREYAVFNRGDMSDLSRFESTVELVPGTMRGSPAGNKLVTSQLADRVLFRLQLTFDPGEDAQFDAALLKDGRKVFVVEQAPLVRDSRGSEVRVQFPKQMLDRGQYQVSLSRRDTQFAPVMYNFTAE